MKLKNRIVMPPMITNYGSQDGYVTERLKDYYEERAKGGVSMVIVEPFCIDFPVGRRLGPQLLIDGDSFIPGLGELAQVMKKHGARAIAQFQHAGRNTSSSLTGLQPIAPSAIAQPGGELPRELAVGEIKDIVAKFAKAAERAKKAGFDGVEIHGAHGYLIAQFLSLASNKRKDEYGGSLENRARLLIEILKATKESVGSDYPVWSRINGEESGVDDAFTLDEAKELARMLQDAGADAVHVSEMIWGIPPGTLPPMDQALGSIVHLAAEIKKAVTIPVIAVKRIEPELGERILQEGKVDFVAIGRALIADPELPNKVASGRLDDIRPCLACNTCVFPVQKSVDAVRCMVNATVGREREYRISPAAKSKKVVVIGGGPAGMEAARVASLRRHQVTLYDRGQKLGGQLLLAAMPPHKRGVERLTNYLITQISKLGVKVVLGKEATPEVIDESKPDVVIVAVGSKPLIPKIKGLERKKSLVFTDVLSGNIEVGKRVIVIGGGFVGCETAAFLAEQGKKVTIIEILPELASGPYYPYADMVATLLVRELNEKGVEVFTGVKEEEITDEGVAIVDKDGNRLYLETDDVVIAVGSETDKTLFESLKEKVPEIHLAGDCVEPRNIREAISDGYCIALGI